MGTRSPGFPVAIESGGPLGAFTLSASVLDHAPVGMLIGSADGRILWANAAMDDVLGVDHTGLPGSNLLDHVHRDDRAAIAEYSAQLASGRTTGQACEFRWITHDGGERWVGAHSSLARDQHGHPLTAGDPPRPCVIHQLLDTTERKRADAELAAAHRELQERSAELERSNEELTQFAFVASHDLSEPLRVIAGHVELLARRYDEEFDDAARQWIDYAIDGCTRMRALIDDLLRYSRVGREMVRRQVALADVVAAAEAQLATSVREAGAAVEVGDLPVVTGDPGGLLQLFTNLLANAVKYADPGRPPRVQVSAARTDAGWAIRVSDNGQGIPAHQRERVFRIFQRLHGREVPGTGIGLAICRKVADIHGGTIEVAGTPGGGATFTVLLPAEAR